MFAERGLRATTVRDIADSAGILSGSLYHHFSSKEEMVDELLRGFLDWLFERYSEIVATESNPLERLKGLFMASFEAIADRHSQVVIYQDEAKRLSSQERFFYVEERNKEQRKMWLDLLNQGVTEGYFRPDIDVDLVYRFIRDTTWVSVRWYQPGGPLTADEVGRHYLSIVLGGITKKDSHDWNFTGLRHRRCPHRRRQAKRIAGRRASRRPRSRGMARPVRPRRRRSRRCRRRDRGLRRRYRRPGGQHRQTVVVGRRVSGRGARCHRRPAVRFESAGHFLWRTGDHVRYRRPDRGGRHAEHEPDPDFVGDDRRRTIRVHLADERIQELAASLWRSGDLAVPWLGVDRREVGHLARGDGGVLTRQPPARAGSDPRPGTSRTRSSRSTGSSPTRARATRRWRRWRASRRSSTAAG